MITAIGILAALTVGAALALDARSASERGRSESGALALLSVVCVAVGVLLAAQALGVVTCLYEPRT